MNAPESIFTVQLGEAEVRVPREAAVMAYLEQEIDRRRPLPALMAGTAAQLESKFVERLDHAYADAPAIGAEWQGGVYAGLTLHENSVQRMVLLPSELESGTWDAAMKWAAEQGGALPTRIDQLVLWQNLRTHFQPAAYWSCEEYASVAECAWGQGFTSGYQYAWHKSYETRARAVRRISI